MNIRSLITLLALAALLVPAAANAYPNVGVQHVVTVNNAAYTVIQDDKDPMQWYLIPSVARVAENKNKEPEFTLLKYQTVDEKDKEKLIEGGLILFSVTLYPDGNTEGKIKNEIANLSIMKAVNATATGLRLAGVPMENAKVNLFDYGDEFIAKADPTEGIGSSVSTAKIPFAVKLTKLGAKTFEELARQTTGYKISIDYEYTAITQKMGCKVTFDWSKVQTHVSSMMNQKTAGTHCYWWHPWHYWHCWGYSREDYNKSTQSVMDQLKQDSSITIDKIVDKTGKTDWDEAKADQLIQPVLDRIKEKLIKLEAIEFKDVEPAKAAEAKQPEGWWGYRNTNTSYSEKKVEKSVLVKETFSYNVQYLVTQPAQAGGFIGLGDYPKEIQDRHIVNVGTTGDFQYAVFSLPPVGEDLDIQKVSYTIAVVKPDGTKNDSTTAEWLPPAENEERAPGDLGWRDPQKTARRFLLFALKAYYDEAKAAGKDIKDYKFETTIAIQRQIGKKVEEKKKSVVADLFSGDVPVSSPFAAFNAIQIYGDFLTYDVQDETSTLKTVQVKVSYPEPGKTKPKSETFVLKPEKDGTFKTNPWLTYIDEQCDPITLEVTYNYADLSNSKKMLKATRKFDDLMQEQGSTVYLENYTNEDGELVYFNW